MRSLIGGILDRAPVPYTSGRQNAFTTPGSGGGGRTAQLAAMGATGTLHAIVSSLAYDTAAVDWHLYRTPAPGTPDGQREEVTRHLALDVWTKPNDFFHRQLFVETIQQHLDLPGEAYWVVVKAGSIPLEMWPVRPDRMEPVPSVKDYLKGWVYTGPGGEKVPLDLDEVIQLRLPDPMDPYRGLGPVGTILADIDSARFGAEWNRNFFLNSAQPGGIIKVDKRLSDDEFNEMRDRWRQQHQGVAQAHRVAILEQGEWVDRSYSVKDMQFTELRNLSSERIREAYRYPLPMLGTVENVNRANAEAARVIYATGCLVPRLERIKLALNGFFLPLFGTTGRGVEFDYDSPVPEDEELEQSDRTSKATAFSTYRQAGVSARSAARVVGLPEDLEMDAAPPPTAAQPPQDGGPSVSPTPAARHPRDDRALTMALATSQTLAAAVRTALTHSAPAPRRHARDDTGAPRAAAVLPEAPGDATPAELPTGAGPDLTPVQDSWQQALDALLATWAGYTTVQKTALVEQVRQAVAAGDVIALTGLHAASLDAAAALEEAMVALAADAAGQVVAEAAAQDVTISTGTVQRFGLAATAQVAAASLTAGLAMSAGRAALRSWGPGSTPDQVTTVVTEHLDLLTDAQAEDVLGGALTQAQHEGRLATITAGPSAALYSDEVLDRATCPNCRAVNRKWLGNSDDPLRPWLLTYPIRGYLDCLGRDRCRGQVVAVWRGGSDWRKWVELPEQRGDG